jgi:hypothetical protein
LAIALPTFEIRPGILLDLPLGLLCARIGYIPR